MKSLFKKVIDSLAISAMLMPSLASAAWWTPHGLMSNVCVAPSGHVMVFQNASGLVGTGCRFVYFNMPNIVFYGTWQ